MENGKANHILDKSSHRKCSVRKDVVRNFAKFTGNHLCQGLFMPGPKTLIKKRFWHRCFAVNVEMLKFANCLRTTFLQNISRRLPLLINWATHRRHISRFQRQFSLFAICNLFYGYFATRKQIIE